MKTLPSYTTPAGNTIEPGMIVTDGTIRLYVKSIEDCGGDYVAFHGRQIVIPGRGLSRIGKGDYLDGGYKGTSIVSMGVLSPAAYTKLRLDPPTPDVITRFTARRARRRHLR